LCSWEYCSCLNAEGSSGTICSHFVSSSLIFWVSLFVITCSQCTVWWSLGISLWLSALHFSRALSRRVLMRILCPAQSLFSR
jgi:hypothetical protein